MKARFTDEQIIQMIKEEEAGERTAGVCRRHGISQGTFYKYKSKYGGMEPSDTKRLKALEDENARLKELRSSYAAEKLQVRRRGGRKRALGTRKTMVLQDSPIQCWSLDFASDVRHFCLSFCKKRGGPECEFYKRGRVRRLRGEITRQSRVGRHGSHVLGAFVRPAPPVWRV